MRRACAGPLAGRCGVLRARLVPTLEALGTCNGGGVSRTPGEQVAGFQVPVRGPVRLLRKGERPLLLTAATRHTLPKVLEASPRS